jgi:hypothetical protein
MESSAKTRLPLHSTGIIYPSPSLHSHFGINFTHIYLYHWGRESKGSCWGPSASEGPQKHDLTMFLEYNTWAGTFRLRSFGLGSKPQCEEAQSIWRMKQSRSYAQGSFSMIAEKGTDLKMKRLFRPRWITIELLANVKGMGVILHGLHPVPINRWTVLPYWSRWLGICFCVSLVLLPSFKPKIHL